MAEGIAEIIAEAVEPTPAPEPEWRFDFTGWKRKDLKAFREKASAGDEEAVLPFYMRSVVSWPYADLNPGDLSSYDELSLEGWVAVNEKFAAALAAVFQRTR